ncbi:hypothetical protein KUTeg_011986 [Tegillarca granosa]|uniref:Uncharacterized protein n=1 Tax=Tegillarca granosa TaxID=220873 RepID=A0ABQ9F1Q0_TEGGR|nr:hypothetical protein KUTeg_011986 [Tegillarca granosa]
MLTVPRQQYRQVLQFVKREENLYVSLFFYIFSDAAVGLFHSKAKIFAFNSNNALLQFILEGTPQVTEYFVDSKKDVDQELKKTCEDFIHHVSSQLTEPLKTFLSRVRFYTPCIKSAYRTS